MQCPRCKTANASESVACWRCGHAPRGAVAVTAPAAWTPAESWSAPPPPPPKRKWPIFVVLIVVLIGSIVGATYVGRIALGAYRGDRQVDEFIAGKGRTVTRPDGAFTARFPTNPDYQERQVNGITVRQLENTVGTDHAFVITWADTNGARIDLDQFTEQAGGKFGEMTASSSRTFQNRPAREMLFRKGSQYRRVMVFSTSKRFYLLGAANLSATDTESFKTFLNAFTLQD